MASKASSASVGTFRISERVTEARQPSKFELHHGFVVAFAGGTIDHGQVSLNLQNILDRLFPAPCQVFGSDVKVRVSSSTVLYPDAGVVCSEVDPHATFVDAPLAIAEILSPSTRAYDLVEKRAAYRSISSLEFYIVVHTSMRRVEIDSRNSAGSWSTISVDDGYAYLGARERSLDEVYARSSLAS